MNLIMPEAEYTETGQGVRERFERRGTSPISKLVIVSRDLDAVQAANAHYAKLNIRPWEWIGPVVATDLGLTA
jgi:hypothetical protein